MAKDDGGPAFPRSVVTQDSKGVSLRDWFAGQALVGLVAYNGTNGLESNEYGPGILAYKLADAMLRARAGKG